MPDPIPLHPILRRAALSQDLSMARIRVQLAETLEEEEYHDLLPEQQEMLMMVAK